jgi:hypothetical protein
MIVFELLKMFFSESIIKTEKMLTWHGEQASSPLGATRDQQELNGV